MPFRFLIIRRRAMVSSDLPLESRNLFLLPLESVESSCPPPPVATRPPYFPVAISFFFFPLETIASSPPSEFR